MTKRRVYSIIGTKSSLLNDEDTDAWVYIDGEPERTESPKAYYKIIPTLYRGVDKRAKAISTLPWALMKGETEFDSSENYENKTGLIANMVNFLWITEASLTLAGESFWKWEQNRAGYKKLRHLDPTSLSLDMEKAKNGEYAWKRSENSSTRVYTKDDLVYLCYSDPYVEIGAPQSYPAKVALNACGVLANLDEFAKKYFLRGAIKAMIFAMAGAPKEEAEKLERWFARFVNGIKNAFTTKAFNSEKVQPVIIGEGIKELENVTLTGEKREEIAAALDIPFSILFSNAANYATAVQDKRNWYDDFVVPEAQFIASVLNEQIFTPLGLTLVFKPETLDIFQEDEAQRSQAMASFIDSVVKADSLELAQAAFEIFGFEISDSAMALLEKYFAEPEPEPAPNITVSEVPQLEAGAPQVGMPMEQAYEEELRRWERKSLNALKKGKSPQVTFESVVLSPKANGRIYKRLEECQTDEDVRKLFALNWYFPPDEVKDDSNIQALNITALLEGIKLGVEALKEA